MSGVNNEFHTITSEKELSLLVGEQSVLPGLADRIRYVSTKFSSKGKSRVKKKKSLNKFYSTNYTQQESENLFHSHAHLVIFTV